VRFNHARVRQAGQVQQASIGLKLINEGRHADLHITLAGDPEVDLQRLSEGLQQLRETLPLLPQDPYLLLNHNGWQSNNVQQHPLPDTEQVVEEIAQAAEGLDLVGFYAAGPISRGFASSAGAFGWHQANSFNFDFSLFHENGEAVKASYAGHEWSSEGFARRSAGPRATGVSGPTVAHARTGQYRAYLAPAALEEIMACSAGAVSPQSIASKSSPLQKLYVGDQAFSRWCRWTKKSAAP
jgi:predicted Zn-dependent protease